MVARLFILRPTAYTEILPLSTDPLLADRFLDKWLSVASARCVRSSVFLEGAIPCFVMSS